MKKVIRSSEIGTYLYCKRAWWYAHNGERSGNQAAMQAGTALHKRHGQQVLLAGLLRGLAILFLLAAVVLGVAYCTLQVI